MLVKSGSFPGTATYGLTVTGIPFQPDLVIVKATQSPYDTWFKTKDMDSTTSYPIRSDGGGDTNHIVAITPDGFTVSADAAVNANAQTISWLAVKDNGQNDFSTISFTGTGGDDVLVFTAFQPDYAMLKTNDGIVGAHKFNSQPSATGNQASNLASMSYQGGSDRQDLIYFGADGMRVSNGDNSGANLVNRSGVPTFGFVFKNASNVSVGTYTASGTAGQAVSAGFAPSFVLINDNAVGQSVSSYISEAAGTSQQWDGAAQTDIITSLTSTGFTIGSSTYGNTAGNTVKYFALGDKAAAVSVAHNLTLLGVGA